MSSASRMLNNYLATWEDTSQIWNLIRALDDLPELPVLRRAASFRKEMLTSGPAFLPMEEFNVAEEGADGSVGQQFRRIYSKLATIPMVMMGWTRSSRRVFTLTPEMQHAFSYISVADVPIKDICFPFDSFLIELPSPIENGDHTISHIMVSKMVSGSAVQTRSIRLFDMLNQNLLEYRPLTKAQNIEAGDLLRRKNKRKIQMFLERYGAKRIQNLYRFRAPMVAFNDDSEYTAPTLVTQQNLSEAEALMTKIVLNLCLYLEALSGTEHETHADRQWNRTGPKNRTEFIADEMEVCEIKGFHTLRTLSGHHSNRDGAYEITEPYWRRGHKRRRPGEGRNPLAVKSVKVLPSLVRADLIPEYGLPVGAVTLVS